MEMDKAWWNRLCFLHDWILDTFKASTIKRIKWQDDSHATAWDANGASLQLVFQGKVLLADGRIVARMPDDTMKGDDNR